MEKLVLLLWWIKERGVAAVIIVRIVVGVEGSVDSIPSHFEARLAGDLNRYPTQCQSHNGNYSAGQSSHLSLSLAPSAVALRLCLFLWLDELGPGPASVNGYQGMVIGKRISTVVNLK